MRLAVFGARERSLGWEVGQAMDGLGAGEVRTYGISGDEDVLADINGPHVGWTYDLAEWKPTAVFCTIGVNEPADVGMGLGFEKAMYESFTTNVIAPLRVLRECQVIPSVEQFVAVSSNSAHIARRGSVAYCSSKAALSMALRCAARERVLPLIYGYEFGLLANTPMTLATAERFPGPLSRMVGAENGLNVHQVARTVIANLLAPTHGFNGVMLRLDAGEQ